MATQIKTESWLIFVDTNIFLDFYRLGGESANRQIYLLEKHKDKIILSEQIRMEFLRNRQRVILESITKLEKPKIPSYPPIVTDNRATKTLSRHLKKAQDQYNLVKGKIENILRDPTHHDPVYQALNRLLENDSRYNLRRPNKQRFEIRNLARKRFILGYPPRKQNDTSIGDALNWEWIIRCAQNSEDKCNVLIVTRDSDYGVTYGQNTYINDWLSKEFKDRVSRKRKVILTNKLTYALKQLSETVTDEDIKSEERIIEQKSPSKDSYNGPSILARLFQKILEAEAEAKGNAQTDVSSDGDPLEGDENEEELDEIDAKR